jgi:hypothetical protein
MGRNGSTAAFLSAQVLGTGVAGAIGATVAGAAGRGVKDGRMVPDGTAARGGTATMADATLPVATEGTSMVAALTGNMAAAMAADTARINEG